MSEAEQGQRVIRCPIYPLRRGFSADDCRGTTSTRLNNQCSIHRCTSSLRMCRSCAEGQVPYSQKTMVAKPESGEGLCARHLAEVRRATQSGAGDVIAAPSRGPSSVPGAKDSSSQHKVERNDPEPPQPAEPSPPDAREEEGGIAKLAWAKTLLRDAPVVLLDPAVVRPMPGQPRVRFDATQLAALARSIEDVGQIQPIIARQLQEPDGLVTHEIIDGERRWRAVTEIGGMQLRCQVLDVADVEITFILAVISNFNRAGHTPFETSCALKRLRDTGLSVRDVARICGMSETYAGQILCLQDLDPDLLPLLERGRGKGKRRTNLPVIVAIAIAKAPLSRQRELAERFMRGELSVATVRGAVVKAADEAGEKIAVRERSPSERWETFERGVEILRESARKLEAGLKKLPPELLAGRGEEVEAIVSSLKEAGGHIERLLRALQTPSVG